MSLSQLFTSVLLCTTLYIMSFCIPHGEGTSVGFRSSTVKFVPLNCKHLWYFFTNMICQHSTFFFSCIGIFFEVILFLYPTVPFLDLFKSCVFWKSQEQEQQVQDLKKQINLSKSLIPESPMTRGLNTCSWAADVFGPTKTQGDGGSDEATHVCFPPKKGLKVFWCQGANPKIKRKPRNNTWSWMNWDVWWVMSFFLGGGWFRIEECVLGPTFF